RSQGVALLVDHLHTQAPEIREQVPGISDELAAIVMSLLAKDPEKRPASAALLLRQLQTLGTESAKIDTAPHIDTAASQQVPTTGASKRAPGRARSALVAALCCALFLLG